MLISPNITYVGKRNDRRKLRAEYKKALSTEGGFVATFDGDPNDSGVETTTLTTGLSRMATNGGASLVLGPALLVTTSSHLVVMSAAIGGLNLLQIKLPTPITVPVGRSLLISTGGVSIR